MHPAKSPLPNPASSRNDGEEPRLHTIEDSHRLPGRNRKRADNATTIVVSILGFFLLFVNTEITRRTFRDLIESSTFGDLSDEEYIGPTSRPSSNRAIPFRYRRKANNVLGISSDKNASTFLNDDSSVISNQSLSVIDNATTNHPFNWTDSTRQEDGNLQIEFFDRHSLPTKDGREGMSACLINLEDTIRLAEWIPYHYAILPLRSLVIALDPNTSERGIRRTLELIDLWKDKIEITLWPLFVMDEDKNYREVAYIRARQVYFANKCLAYHKRQNRSWTLLTDNDEYLIFNYIHDDEKIKNDHPGAKRVKVREKIKHDREVYMPFRKDLPELMESTVLDFIHRKDANKAANETDPSNSTDREFFLPSCVRLPGIKYGGDSGVNQSYTEAHNKAFENDFIDPQILSTLRDVHHAKRSSKFSKVMVDVSRVQSKLFEWTKHNNVKTIHNPCKACGFNGAHDTGADYYSSLFRLNHYLGSPESYLERQGDYRSRSLDMYWKKAAKVNASVAHWDEDIRTWLSVLVQSVGSIEEARRLLAPIAAYVNATPQPVQSVE